METLGKYRLDARLGGGGMAEVFLASAVGAEGFSRKVAIKRVLPGFSENPAFAKMFIDEARISSRLVHPNIVSVVDFDRDNEGRLYLVMELVEGKDLDNLGSSGPLPIPVVIYVISEVLRGLGHAHDLPASEGMMRGIVHRDVSPHNVLLGWEGSVKVSDFGIAKARSASSATASVFIKGKPAYMSPEQANGENLDGRSDLFAVGVMLWELLVGRRLFVGEDTRATLAAVLFGQIPRPRSLRGDVPKDLERVTMKLLERELPARYATAEEAVKDLLDCAAAPRDGRELLKQTLAERFPQQAPIRHSAMRSQAGSTPAPMGYAAPQGYAPPGSPATAAGYSQQGPAPQGYPPHPGSPAQPGYPSPGTYADGVAGRPSTPPGQLAPAMPSLGQARQAQTGTMQPAAVVLPLGGRRPKGRLVVIGVSSFAGLVVLIALIASATRNPPAPPDPKTSIVTQGSAGSGSAAPAGSAAAATVPPTPAPDAAVPVPPPDAAVVAEPTGSASVDAKKGATTARPGEKRMGRLQVKAFPVLTVYVDNSKIHDTPVDIELPTGKHKLRLVSSEGKDEVVTVTIEENKPTIIDRN